MTVRYRRMRPTDAREAVELAAAHPVISARYGSEIVNLKSAWLHLMTLDGSGVSAVFEEVAACKAKIIGIGVSAFVTDEFMRELKTPAHFWIGPEIVKRISRGDSPLLSPQQVREANSRGGLNLVVWKSVIPVEHVNRIDLWDAVMVAFREYHRGYLLKELVGQGESLEHLLGMRNSGGLLWSGGRHREFWDDDVGEILAKPHVVGMTRELAAEQSGSWVSSLFLYRPPQFGFSRSEQRLLLFALNGGTDQELSDELQVSITTVKKTWRLIYDRVAVYQPDLVPASATAENGTSERGREKKQRLIAYLREHPEELRPVSRKILQHDSSRHPGG